jgi:hypothetical protein
MLMADLCSSVPRGTYLDEHKYAWTSRLRNINYVPQPRGTEEHNETYVPRGTPRNINPLCSSVDDEHKNFLKKLTILFAPKHITNSH